MNRRNQFNLFTFSFWSFMPQFSPRLKVTWKIPGGPDAGAYTARHSPKNIPSLWTVSTLPECNRLTMQRSLWAGDNCVTSSYVVVCLNRLYSVSNRNFESSWVHYVKLAKWEGEREVRWDVLECNEQKLRS